MKQARWLSEFSSLSEYTRLYPSSHWAFGKTISLTTKEHAQLPSMLRFMSIIIVSFYCILHKQYTEDYILHVHALLHF